MPSFAAGVNLMVTAPAARGRDNLPGRAAEALDTAGIDLVEVDAVDGREADAPFGVTIVCLGAEGLPPGLRLELPAGVVVALAPWRPGPVAPAGLDRFDAVWGETESATAAAASAAPDAPAHVVRLPVTAAAVSPPYRAPLGLPAAFLVLARVGDATDPDAGSGLRAVEAFARAFPPSQGAAMVVEAENLDGATEPHASLLEAAKRHGDIQVVPQGGAVERRLLLAACDAYLSLPATAGFGLPTAEALAQGKPVVTTRLAGSLVHGGDAIAFLLDVMPEASGAGAQPDLDAAATALKAIRRDPDAAARRGARAASHVAEAHSAAAGAASLVAALEALPAPRRARRRVPKPDSGVLRLARAQRRLRALGAEVVAQSTEARSAQGRLTAVETRLAALDAHATALDIRAAGVDQHAATLEATMVPVLAGAFALPYAAGDPYTVFAHPVAGRVQGYRAADANPDGDGDGDGAYAAFEAIFRGPRARVSGLLAGYVELLRDAAPVLDLGCGRGELLELLLDAGIEASGVDSDPGMVAEARAAGLPVTLGDGLEHLAALPSRSLGAVVSIQVIEHLPHPQIGALLRLAADRLREEGVFVAETVNPHAPFALKTFWVDLTHQHPIFPEVALALAMEAGFPSAFVFHPRGTRDVEVDRFGEDSYALVATAQPRL